MNNKFLHCTFLSFVILVDCVWSSWSSWMGCDCNIWKRGANKKVFKYRTVFQSRNRTIIENAKHGGRACVHLEGTESKKCPNFAMVRNCVPKSNSKPRKLVRISKTGEKKQPALGVIEEWLDKHGKTKSRSFKINQIRSKRNLAYHSSLPLGLFYDNFIQNYLSYT